MSTFRNVVWLDPFWFSWVFTVLNRLMCYISDFTPQVFFPVPYAYYDPNIVYRQAKIPDVIPIHKDTGHWSQGPRDMACFDNKDYKDMRMNRDDFLREDKSEAQDFMQVQTLSLSESFKLRFWQRVSNYKAWPVSSAFPWCCLMQCSKWL